MRRDEVAPALQQYLQEIEGMSHVCAMVAPPTPRILETGPATNRMIHEAALALGQLKGFIASGTPTDLLTRTLARREAVQSSQIEGTKASLPHLLAYEITHSTEGHPPDVVETERYVSALQVGLEAIRVGGRSALDLQLVHRLHAVLMEHAGPGFPRGRYRDEQAWIGSGHRIKDASFVPAPPDRIEACMQDLERNALQYAPLEDETTSLHIVVQMAIVHAQFETIHPYKDGNGRTGRLLLPLILAAEHHPPLYLSGTLLRNRQGYYAALHRVQLRGEWSPWVDLLCRAIVESARDAIAIANDLNALTARWTQQVAKFRSDSVARKLPPLLIGYPVVDPARVVSLLDVSDRSARTGIDQLVGLGILREQTGRKRGRIYEAPDVLERLDRPPGAA